MSRRLQESQKDAAYIGTMRHNRTIIYKKTDEDTAGRLVTHESYPPLTHNGHFA